MTDITPLSYEDFLNEGSATWNSVADYIHGVNVTKGFWPENVADRNVGEALCLIHSEISEAFEAVVTGDQDDKIPEYSGFSAEIADTMIRVLDLGGALGADFDTINWYDTEGVVTVSPFTSVVEDLLVAHLLVSRALEHDRKGRREDMLAELVSLFAYCMELLYKHGIPLAVIFDKVAYNIGRPFKHGKAY